MNRCKNKTNAKQAEKSLVIMELINYKDFI